MFQQYLIVGAALVITAFAGLKTYDWLYPPKTRVKLVFKAQMCGEAFQRNDSPMTIRAARDSSAFVTSAST